MFQKKKKSRCEVIRSKSCELNNLMNISQIEYASVLRTNSQKTLINYH